MHRLYIYIHIYIRTDETYNMRSVRTNARIYKAVFSERECHQREKQTVTQAFTVPTPRKNSVQKLCWLMISWGSIRILQGNPVLNQPVDETTRTYMEAEDFHG